MYSPWTCTIGSHVLWFVCLQMTWDFQDQAFPKPTPSFLECRICVIFWVPGTLELPIYICLHRLVWASLFLLTIDYGINVHILRREGWRKSGCLRRLGPKGFVRSDPSHEALWYRMELGVRIKCGVSRGTGPRARVWVLFLTPDFQDVNIKLEQNIF